jgi:hypothetical protein
MKIVLTVLALALAASPCFAYVQAGHLEHGSKTNVVPFRHDGDGDPSANAPAIGGSGPGLGINEPSTGPEGILPPPTKPVPEPGMMALASMGLLALGVAGRKRRGR